MATTLSTVEHKLEELFVKNAPKLPENGKKTLVSWFPVISLIVGLFSLWAAYGLWHWAHIAEGAVRYANDLCNAYSVAGCGTAVGASRFSFWLWAGVIMIGIEGVLYLLAFPGLRDHKKQGWNYLFYGALLNIAYAVISLFTGYRAFGSFIGALIGSAIGFYLLFQVRSAYSDKGRVHAVPKDAAK